MRLQFFVPLVAVVIVVGSFVQPQLNLECQFSYNSAGIGSAMGSTATGQGNRLTRPTCECIEELLRGRPKQPCAQRGLAPSNRYVLPKALHVVPRTRLRDTSYLRLLPSSDYAVFHQKRLWFIPMMPIQKVFCWPYFYCCIINWQFYAFSKMKLSTV